MPDTPEYLTLSRFYFELSGGAIGNSQTLLVSKVSGVTITLEAAAEGESLGVSKGAKSETQITVAGTTQSNITLEFVVTRENDILEQWYKSVHPTSMDGGGTDWEKNRASASLVFYAQNGKEGARFNLRDAIPAKYTSTPVSADSTDMFKETVEIAHAGLNRMPPGGSTMNVAPRK
ncbi:phage tail protein [Spirulina subsalsa FACHB-351]|uniref:Phage tail protein n=1 Tax=Spirulina subsalsa FACHB-351 TaxID=234711 RepID=A0ABT3L9A7_9CYAN|nr:phage tail protein [Spirulina subsalsa]MCW6038098.1 phage tail protein [Spirulina subsalsa FACHB-351]